MKFTRRKFIGLTSATTAGVILAPTLKNLAARLTDGDIKDRGFGELVTDPKGILDLPRGFNYRILSRTGTRMDDGSILPDKFDGMGAFAGEKETIVLVRNHELEPGDSSRIGTDRVPVYDRKSSGGTTTLILDKNLQPIREFVSLAGTDRNCAGGVTPWGSWISSEEDTEPGHGYNFEVPGGGISNAEPLMAMGKFRHEAIAFSPDNRYIYQTEDRPDGSFYRFTPEKRGDLRRGILEALVIEGNPGIDTGIDFPLNRPLKVRWVKIEDVNPKGDTLRMEARMKGAAVFRRGEGICTGDGFIYWTCTNGGKAGKGQIFRHDPVKGTIELFVESPGEAILDFPDNIIRSSFGDLIVCEDGRGEQFLVGITPEGRYYRFARNAMNNSEFAGVCFSPDGGTMFVNIYSPGLTLAIRGNWRGKV